MLWQIIYHVMHSNKYTTTPPTRHTSQNQGTLSNIISPISVPQHIHHTSHPNPIYYITLMQMMDINHLHHLQLHQITTQPDPNHNTPKLHPTITPTIPQHPPYPIHTILNHQTLPAILPQPIPIQLLPAILHPPIPIHPENVDSLLFPHHLNMSSRKMAHQKGFTLDHQIHHHYIQWI